MHSTPYKSFQKQSTSPSLSCGISPHTKDQTSGRFIPNRIISSFRSIFSLSDENETSSLYSSVLGDSGVRQSRQKALRPRTSLLQQLENKENKSLAPLSFPKAQLAVPQRAIPKVPFRVLDAPQLQDDFYLNVLDWSCDNNLAVGLGTSVYLWAASTGKVVHLADTGTDLVSSTAWAQRGGQLAVATSTGKVLLYDAVRSKMVRSLPGHEGRVGALAWNNWLLSSGSRDKTILHRDLRASEISAKALAHSQEVCGLKWAPGGEQLASGGNDNKLYVWSARSLEPVGKFEAHVAAVKAIAWSPHQRGVLASGGGTADRTIRFWNTLDNSQIQCVDTESQVCNLIFSKNYNELVSTHGYSQNQIHIWKCPSMVKTATLLGHSSRVLYLAISPDSQTIVTGAGDETLRFWNAFSLSQTSSPGACSLFPSLTEIR